MFILQKRKSYEEGGWTWCSNDHQPPRVSSLFAQVSLIRQNNFTRRSGSRSFPRVRREDTRERESRYCSPQNPEFSLDLALSVVGRCWWCAGRSKNGTQYPKKRFVGRVVDKAMITSNNSLRGFFFCLVGPNKGRHVD